MGPTTSEPPADAWPRELTSGDNTFSIFQPQYDRWEQGRLDGRSAVAVESQASPEPRYGVIWFTARTQVDKETGMVTLEDLTISKADFRPPDGGAGYLAALKRSLADAPLTIALDRLQAELEVEQAETPAASSQCATTPRGSCEPGARAAPAHRRPARPAVGRGHVAPAGDQHAVLLLLDQSAGRTTCGCGISGRGSEARRALGGGEQPVSPWGGQAGRGPGVAGDLLNDVDPDLAPLLQAGSTPTIYVSTTPASSSCERPAASRGGRTAILEVTNSDEDLFLYTPEQAYYVLLSGRWFRARRCRAPGVREWRSTPEDFAPSREPSERRGARLRYGTRRRGRP